MPSWIPGYDAAQLRAAQLEDADLRQVHRWMDLGRRPSRDEAASLSPAARSYWLNLENLRWVDGVLYLNWVSNQGLPDRLQLLVPRCLRAEVIFCHDSLVSGCMGVLHTVNQVEQRFHWPGPSKDVKVHIRSCATCNANGMPYQRFRAALAGFRVGAPLDRVGIDLMGPLPVSERGNRYLLVIVDYFTRWAEAFPLPDQQAESLAKAFVHEFVCRYGAPLEIHSDQGRNFESALFQEICQWFDIIKKRSSPYHPNANGLVEHFNRTLTALIRSYLESRLHDWDSCIPLLTCAYRSTSYPSTGFSPNFLMFGREVNAPVDLLFPRPQTAMAADVPLYVQDLLDRLQECYELARESCERLQSNKTDVGTPTNPRPP